ncbi:PEBP-like protein [Metschnikowia bicuspidata var. bicuspidata NRRL YB-4993]|uniref:PEBP-like protein n=1 Tax=Metschnikowia bicuspidata var. bicuspidata NRRL YB-4993 TaxID=869754 RepID=A0A1A0HH76_9ASCO|nr:PEBP-like protein [Metschnikowia bicuspidata var. bicuspidata NRRL YB-4993]OBA23232.1 PEBP-like protein [Metschnikowia bicuspidata var. bicuspidata NRRL YB-4993]
MSLKFARLFSSQARSLGVWTDAASRPGSLRIADEAVRQGVLHGIPASGPKLIAHQGQRETYHSPVAIDEVFAGAYEILEQEAAQKYRALEASGAQMSAKDVENTLAAAEQHNPEVLYNARFQTDNVDRAHPVYRRFLRQKWQLHDLMVTMQRLEQHHVIPDTLPTVEPCADVRVKFGHNEDPEFADWVVPGTKLPALAVARPPTVQVQEFETAADSCGLYCVLLVNPDVPDVAANSFRTSLNFGLHNVPLTFTDNTIGPATLLAHPAYVFQQYEPLVPERNAPVQRACLWVFRQTKALERVDFSRDAFDIRAFVADHGLQPIGAHVWRQEFDRSVEAVRKQHGLPAGRVFDPVRGSEPLV